MPNSPAHHPAQEVEAPGDRWPAGTVKHRLNLDLTPEAYGLLRKLANESGKNMADVLRTGLARYGIHSEQPHQSDESSDSSDNGGIV